MRRAIELSLQNVHSGNGGPFGALVVKDDEIVGEGANQVLATNDPSAHAEVIAIRAACRKLKTFQLTGCEIYTSCEPCPMCMGLIYWARPKNVYYANTAADAARIGFDDAFIYQELAKPTLKRSVRMQQLLREEALAAFKAWEQKPDKIPY
ncbi:MAG: tRNA-specific adenosine deaminase [Acidobacteria bacterium]|nr:MAG: tRNA-specific adenosine deaminase [Acidobacteriota bacterium]PYY01063.1 MAG: tRNA-specific adenosine deaminase [Acidobacteriota bacterium]PYY22119.1 MAG: tRNA-specific adenosine deaminase [Acidobacteriota bacterium]